MTRFLAAFLAVALSALAATADPARGCTCGRGDPRSTLASSDGAFIGTLVERRELSRRSVFGGSAVYVFRVLEPVKGRFGPTVEVVAPDNGAACGIEVEVGATIGLFVDRQRSTWRSHLCAQIHPLLLREAARPLPRPDGSGPAAFLVAGRFGAMSTLALDAQGRTLAYGRGPDYVLALAVCPGSRRSVEVVEGRVVRLVVRRLPDLRVVRRRVLPVSPEASVTPSLRCANAAATDVRLFWTDQDQDGRTARILRIGPARTRVLWRGTALFAALGRDVAIVAAGPRGDRLLRVNLATGRATALARVAPTTLGVYLSPDGRRLASVSYSWLTVVDAGGPRVKVRRTRITGCCMPNVLFLSGGRVVVSDGALRVLDRDLRGVGRIDGWYVAPTVLRGGRFVGLAGGTLVDAPVPDGPRRRIRTLPSPVATHLAALP